MGTVLAIGPTSEFFAGDRSAVRIATLLVAAAFAALAIRVARLAAVIDGDELIVRNVFRTYHVPRAQITEIVAPAAYGRMRKAGITVRTVPGKAISISAFAQTPLDSSAGFHEAQVLSTWHDSGESRMPAPPPHGAGPIRAQRSILWRLWLGIIAAVVAFALLVIAVSVANA